MSSVHEMDCLGEETVHFSNILYIYIYIFEGKCGFILTRWYFNNKKSNIWVFFIILCNVLKVNGDKLNFKHLNDCIYTKPVCN